MSNLTSQGQGQEKPSSGTARLQLEAECFFLSQAVLNGFLCTTSEIYEGRVKRARSTAEDERKKNSPIFCSKMRHPFTLKLGFFKTVERTGPKICLVNFHHQS